MYCVAHVFNEEDCHTQIGCAVVEITEQVVEKVVRLMKVPEIAGSDLITAVFEDSSPVFLLNPGYDSSFDQYDNEKFESFLDSIFGHHGIFEELPLPLDELKRRYGVEAMDVGIGLSKHVAGCVGWEGRVETGPGEFEEFHTAWVPVADLEAALEKMPV